jgi:hypothetical protein
MYSPINFAGATPFNDWFLPDTTQRHPLGLEVEAVDPWWGYGKFRYVKSNDAILKGSLVCIGTAPTHLATLTPSTANLGQPVYIAVAPMASGTYGWVQSEGNVVYAMGATAAANAAVGIYTSAGSLTGTIVAGKGIIGVHHYKAPAATITFTANTYNGLGYIDIPGGYDGAFLGLVLTGTGVAAATTMVAKLDPDGKRIYTGSAIGTLDKVQTATGTITLTGTYTGYGMGYISRPHGTQITA